MYDKDNTIWNNGILEYWNNGTEGDELDEMRWHESGDSRQLMS